MDSNPHARHSSMEASGHGCFKNTLTPEIERTQRSAIIAQRLTIRSTPCSIASIGKKKDGNTKASLTIFLRKTNMMRGLISTEEKWVITDNPEHNTK